MSARVYFMKRVKDCKDVSIMSIMNSEDGKVYSVYILHFSCFTKTKLLQITAFSGIIYTKSKNYQIRH